jgi:shikimate 5-dehydrogenase/shikimate kinase
MATKRGLDDNTPVPLHLHAIHHVPFKSNVSPASRSRSTSESPLSHNELRPSPLSNHESLRTTPSIGQLSSASDASIVLIGIRGTGKSSLAVMASSALGFRVIDADRHFFQVTGQSRATFNATHGVQEYRRRELEVMHSVLLDNQSRCVITCGPGSVQGRGQGLLREYSKTHPVIYIMRDTDEIQRYLRAWDPKTVSGLVEMTAPSYRASSSFEFYNISESPSPSTKQATNGQNPPTSLTLKHLQQDFLQLIYNVTKQASRLVEHEAGHSVSLLPPESRQYTYALSLPLSVLTSHAAELRDIKSTADSIQFVVDLPLLTNGQRTFDNTVATNISKQFYLVRRYTQIPIIFHVPSDILKAKKTGTPAEVEELEEAYFELLRFGLRIAPEYLCVDITCNDRRIEELLAAKRSTKIIGYFFDSEPGLDGWSSQDRKEKLQRAERLGCDIVWLCQDATSMLDNNSLQRFASEIRTSDPPHRPLIAYNTGPLGRISCWQNPTLTPVTHSTLRSLQPKSTPDWLLTIHEAQNALYASFTLDKMYFGILGSSVATSLSPAIHEAAYEFCGMPHEYKIFQHSSLKEMEQVFRDPNFGGVSITAPFKREITLLVDFMSQEARAIGAVNTLVPLRGSKMPEALLERGRAGPIVAFYGECTDWIGMYDCVSRSLSPVNTVNARTTGLVLGAGGMARAAVYALIRLGVRNIFICNRTVKKAQEVAEHFIEWSSRSNTGTPNGPKSYSDVRIETLHNNSSRPDHKIKIDVIQSRTEPWPANADPPTIVISALPGRNLGDESLINNSVPADWLASQTGGVVVEVRISGYEIPCLTRLINI